MKKPAPPATPSDQLHAMCHASGASETEPSRPGSCHMCAGARHLASIPSATPGGWTPLHSACCAGGRHIEVARLLVSHPGIDVEVVSSGAGVLAGACVFPDMHTPLCRWCCGRLARWPVANPVAGVFGFRCRTGTAPLPLLPPPCAGGWTPLHLACVNRVQETVALLLAHSHINRSPMVGAAPMMVLGDAHCSTVLAPVLNRFGTCSQHHHSPLPGPAELMWRHAI